MNKNLEKVKVLMGEEMFQKYFERIQEVLKVFGVEVPEDWEYPIQKLEYLSHFNKYVLVDISDKEKLGNRDKIVISLPAPTKSKSSDNLKKEASSAKIKIKDWIW